MEAHRVHKFAFARVLRKRETEHCRWSSCKILVELWQPRKTQPFCVSVKEVTVSPRNTINLHTLGNCKRDHMNTDIECVSWIRAIKSALKSWFILPNYPWRVDNARRFNKTAIFTTLFATKTGSRDVLSTFNETSFSIHGCKIKFLMLKFSWLLIFAILPNRYRCLFLAFIRLHIYIYKIRNKLSLRLQKFDKWIAIMNIYLFRNKCMESVLIFRI